MEHNGSLEGKSKYDKNCHNLTFFQEQSFVGQLSALKMHLRIMFVISILLDALFLCVINSVNLETQTVRKNSIRFLLFLSFANRIRATYFS